jgi:hypothetical protein
VLTAAACGLLGLHAWSESWPIDVFTISVCVSLAALWLGTSRQPAELGLLLVMHLVIGGFLLLGPITAYHLSGRALYDYGFAPDDPMPHVTEYGESVSYPPYRVAETWPAAGRISLVMTRLSLLLFLPPTAIIVAVLALFLILRLSNILSPGQRWRVWIVWLAGSCPLIYLLVWGKKIVDWMGPLTG